MKKFNMQQTIIAVVAIVCLASATVVTKDANAIGYQNVNTYQLSYPSLYWSAGCDTSCNQNISYEKSYNAELAYEQLIGMHQGTHKATGGNNGIVLMHALMVNAKYNNIK